MSSVFKGIKKVFKKVVKVVKKVLPIALAVGALVFTGGAALGLTSVAWGGAGGVAASIGGALGGSGVIGAAMTGAITQAGYGALIGGAMSAAGGGSFSKGAKAGALTGAVMGGATGAYGHLKNAAQGVQQAGVQANGVKTTAMPEAGAPPTGQFLDASGQPIANEIGSSVTAAPNPANLGGGLGGAAKKVGGLFKQGGFIERNQQLVGNVIGGIGQGLAAGAEADAEKDLLRERYNQVRQNYAGSDPSQGYRSAQPSRSGLTPSERFTPGYYGSFEYRYNPETARIERVPVGG